ncbi:MAG: DUF5718 family protein [Patulibacter minatonensis]
MSAAEYPLPDLHALFGFGVAGNFAGHLEQAGEAADFVGIGAAGVEAPKGIFPWFAPSPVDSGAVPEFLTTFPLAHDRILLPAGEGLNLQIEPEVGLLAAVDYEPGSGAVAALRPIAIGAFNDCSIRRPGAKKISHKKNWGPESKGVAARFFAADDLAPDGPTATWRLACFLRRDGEVHPYGLDSRLPDYSYYGPQLLDWIVDRLAHQAGSDESPLEPVGAYLRAAGNPPQVLIGIGATRYTALGESTFLQPGDESLVIVYDAADRSPADVQRAVELRQEDELADASVLRQLVVGAD